MHSSPRRQPAPTGRARQRGVVLIITLLAVFLLAGLVIYVINTGQQVNKAVQSQNTADASAAAGAGWVARSLNTVAMNNVAQAKMIALVNVLDAMPQGVQFTLEDAVALQESVDGQLARGISDSWVRSGVETMQRELRDQIAILEPVDDFFNRAYDVSQMTFYDTGGGRGHLWQAMQSLDEYSQATMENLGVLAQACAVTGAEANQRGDSAAFIVPVAPQVPYVRGEFDDFERPVTRGLLPPQVDDKTTNRGPYDAVFGWRHTHGAGTQGYTIPGSSQGTSGGRGSVPIGRGASDVGARFVVTGRTPPTSYSTWGAHSEMLRHVQWVNDEQTRHLRFHYWVSTLANIKLGYLWPGTGPRSVIDPDWRTSFDEAVEIAEAGTPRIRETAFLCVEIKSRYPRGAAGFLSAGSWAYVETNRDNTSPRVVRLRNWHDPRRWSAPMIEPHVWRDEWDYTVNYDRAIGIAPQYDSDGQAVAQPVYRIDEYIFAGVNVGPDVEVRSPHNFSSRADLPAPTDLDHSQVTPAEGSRREFLTYLAVVRRDDTAQLWPRKFTGDKPFPHVVKIAQSQVFNNHSWDLWTQMWHSQLQKIDSYDNWLQTMEDGLQDADDHDLVDAGEVEQLLTYLRNAKDLAPVMVSH